MNKIMEVIKRVALGLVVIFFSIAFIGIIKNYEEYASIVVLYIFLLVFSYFIGAFTIEWFASFRKKKGE